MNNTLLPLIGIFDSGVGGLTIFKEIHDLLPQFPLFYIADQVHVPYGKRRLPDIQNFSKGITEFLLSEGADIVVVACNTASAAALDMLRQEYPYIPFVGMEPAVKPATHQTKNGVVGVLATPATFQGKMYATLVEKFARDVKILTHTLSGLVELIEAGKLESVEAREIVEKAVIPMVKEGADTIVLGCTHFPFALELIRNAAGPNVSVIDPAPAVAARVKSLLGGITNNVKNQKWQDIQFATTGNVIKFGSVVKALLELYIIPHQLQWKNHFLEYSETR